ncbi:stearoyl-CoA desaturase 5-like [Anneissia japonica]|uniref:stearoyl-CoA desaturase 5-like n=1 Tax=Anneissia japonica TaxID=1529436 RepID=UPI00142590FF|nr:stearoyl-CoA desaturase 5-like [Anneissia japonica]
MSPRPNEVISLPKVVAAKVQHIKEETLQLSVENEEVAPRDYDIVWKNVIMVTMFHIGAVYALVFVVWQCQLMTLMWGTFLWFWTEVGVTAGSHRLWAHRSYKAKWPLRLMLAVLTLIAHQNSAYEWSRDHRVHHKFSETDADPHNAKRGFFFSHVGWLMVKKHPDVIKNGQKIDLGDLMIDPIVRYQHK